MELHHRASPNMSSDNLQARDPMQRCANFWGEHTLRTEPLRTRIVHNAIYMPASTQVFLDRDPHWGIYTESGELVAEAAYERSPHRELVGQSRHLDLRDIDVVDGPFEEMVYAGPIIAHYGHFLLTSLARLWALDGSRPALFHSHPPIFDHNARFILELLAAAGLTRDNSYSFERPTRICRLVVPEASFFEQYYVSRDYSAAVEKIGNAIPETNRFEHRDYYISKARIGSGVASLADEEEIERAFRQEGFEIVYPETLSLPDQISLFRNARTIAGTISSAFHTVVLAPKGRSRQILFDYSDTPNSNFALIEHGIEANVSYYSLSDSVTRHHNDRFIAYYVAKDIESLARKMVQIAMPNPSQHDSVSNENCVPDFAGENYRDILKRLHLELAPTSYLEIGTLNGGTLALANAPSISIDPFFQIETAVIGSKEMCLFFQMGSDTFFDNYDPKQLLGRRLDLSFLDGMHHCEFLLRDFMNAERHSSRDGVIALHDCLPVEIPMTDRLQNGTPPVAPHRGGWWTGDVWRTLYAIKRHRPDLRVLCLDAAPTGLVLISKLNPQSTKLSTYYDQIVDEMLGLDLSQITVSGFLEQMDVQSTRTVVEPGSLIASLRS